MAEHSSTYKSFPRIECLRRRRHFDHLLQLSGLVQFNHDVCAPNELSPEVELRNRWPIAEVLWAHMEGKEAGWAVRQTNGALRVIQARNFSRHRATRALFRETRCCLKLQTPTGSSLSSKP